MEEARHKLIWLEAERELDLCVLYALADADGPLAHEIKIGVSSRKAYSEELRRFQGYRSRPAIARVELVISGKAQAEVLKASLLRTFANGCCNGSWRPVSLLTLGAIVATLAVNDCIATMTQEEAQALEHATFDRIAARYDGRD